MAESRATSVRGQALGQGTPAAHATSVRGQVLGQGTPAARATSLRGQVLLALDTSDLAGRNLRDAYLNLPEGDRPADPKGSYARRIAEGLELDTSNRGSGSWEKVIAQADEEPSAPGSWKTRALRFIRKGLE